MINTKMNILMHRMQIQEIIDYVDNNVSTEFGRAIEKYYRDIQNYVGNKMEK